MSIWARLRSFGIKDSAAGSKPRGAGSAPNGAGDGAERATPVDRPPPDPILGDCSALGRKEQDLYRRIEGRIIAGHLVLPQLSALCMRLVDITSDPSTQIEQVADVVAEDSSLSAEIMTTAFSVEYGGADDAATSLEQAVMRLGLLGVRDLVLAWSLRTEILRNTRLATYAAEVWTQARCAGLVCRAIAAPLERSVDESYLLGLLHDMGKAALLATLSAEVPRATPVSRRLIGRVFSRYHEAAGARLAASWGLSGSIVAVARCHHRFRQNVTHADCAALVSLADRLGLQLRHGAESEFPKVADCPELEFLKVPEDRGVRAILAASQAVKRMEGVEGE